MRFTSGGVEPSDVEIGPDRVEMDGRQTDRTKDANCAGAEAAQDKKSGCCGTEGHLVFDAFRVYGQNVKQRLTFGFPRHQSCPTLF